MSEDTLTVDEIVANLGNRWWRLNNLYHIKDKHGKKVLFKPTAPQTELHNGFWYFIIVPKARQLGITTFFAILYFDAILFSKNKTAGIIAHKKEDVQKIFKQKIKFAWDTMHPWVRKYIGEPDTNSANELSWKDDEGNISTIFVSMSTRSGTLQYLHISEFGKICAKYPEKATEIVTGAINSVEAGNVVSIESTAEGREGYFYDFCMDAERVRKEGKPLTPLDFKIFFFPWWREPEYRLVGAVTITKEMQDYFKLLETKYGIVLDTEQKNWYVKKREKQKDKMFQEYPSTLEECFQSTVQGAYYAVQMQRVYLENRIKPLVYDPLYTVDTWWDLGMNDFNVLLLTQTIHGRIKFIDMFWDRGFGLSHYYNWLKERKDEYGYRYNFHHLPHDVEVKELGTGVSRKQTLYDLGMRNIKVGKKMDIKDGIEKVRQLFNRFEFDEEKCETLHTALFNYRQAFDEKLGTFKDKPLHNDASHFADAVRLLGQLWRDYTPLLEGEGSQEADQAFFA